MRADPLTLDTLAEALTAIIARHGSVLDSGSTWVRSDEVLHDHLGCEFTVSAALHPGEARDAARALADHLDAQGYGIRRRPGPRGNRLSARLVRLAAELAAAAGNPARVAAVADALGALAAEAQDRDDAVVPAHLRTDPKRIPAGVVRLCDRRRRA